LEWIERQRQRLFNIPHFHVVFTSPHEYDVATLNRTL
jgi:hypothetical protein